MQLPSHPSRIYLYSRLSELLQVKLVRKVSRELDKERKASPAKHGNTTFKKVKKIHYQNTQSVSNYKIPKKYSSKRRQSSSPVARAYMKKQ